MIQSVILAGPEPLVVHRHVSPDQTSVRSLWPIYPHPATATVFPELTYCLENNHHPDFGMRFAGPKIID